MYILLSTTFVCIVLTWSLLRRYTIIWTHRPITMTESFFCGTASWLLLIELMSWAAGIILTVFDVLNSHKGRDIWTILLAVSLTVFFVHFIFRTKSEMEYDNTFDFIKETLQFRRSAQQRLSVIELFQQRQQQKKYARKALQTPDALEHAKLQLHLAQGQDVAGRIDQLRSGQSIDLTEPWNAVTEKYATHPFYSCIQEVKIDPARKRLMLFLNLYEYYEETFTDETAELKLFRQTYDFLQSIRNDLRLKPYAEYISSIYMLCRRIKQVGMESEEVLYPFFKAGVLLDDLKNYEGTYFNPRKLNAIAAVAFQKGDQV